MNATLRIGITGPIGCGKSTVAGWLAERGAVVVDADQLARDVVQPGEPALDAVIARFGDGVLTAEGQLDRAALGRIVFGDPAALRDLEAIVHPAVRPRIEAAVARAEREEAPAVVIEAIKLVEAGYAKECDEVWLVTCEPDEQLARLVARGVGEDDAARRIAAQRDTVERAMPLASRVLSTAGDRASARDRALAAYGEAQSISLRTYDPK